MQKRPTLSVLISNYNQGPYLGGCLTAILEQSRPPDEVVVVDDASGDTSHGVLHEFSRWVTRLRYVRHEVHRGAVETLRRGYGMVRSDYVCRIAPTDRVLPRTFEKCMQELERHPDAAMCFGPTYAFDLNVAVVAENAAKLVDTPVRLSADELADKLGCSVMAGRVSPISEEGAIWKRTELERAGGYRTELGRYAGWFALQVMALRGGACVVSEPLAVTAAASAPTSQLTPAAWNEQKILLENLLNLLRADECGDVLSRFQRGGVLSQFGASIVRVIAGGPQYWDRDNALLIEHVLNHCREELLADADPLVRQGTAVCLAQLGPCRISIGSRPSQPVVGNEAGGVVSSPDGPATGSGFAGRQNGSVIQRLRSNTTIRRVWQSVRPVAARMFQTVHYRAYAHLNRLDASLAELTRQHTGRLESLRAEFATLRNEMELEFTAQRWMVQSKEGSKDVADQKPRQTVQKSEGSQPARAA